MENHAKTKSVFSKRIASRVSFRFAAGYLVLVTFIAIFATVIANEKPLFVRYKGTNLFPALSLKGYADVFDDISRSNERIVYTAVNWRELKKEKVIWCPVIFSPGKSDWPNNGYKSPLGSQVFTENGKTSEARLGNRHWLGTTKTGADVFSGILHGTRISLAIGVFSMLIAGFTGIMLGALAGFFGDHRIIVSKTGLITGVLFGLPLAWFYGIYHPYRYIHAETDFIIPLAAVYFIALLIALVCLCAMHHLGALAGRALRIDKKVTLPVDQLVSRGIEIFNSIPRIVLIITLSAVARPSVTNLILIIGFTSWTEIARLVRAEMLKVRNAEYILSAEASGIKTIRQLLNHALPNVVIPAITAVTLGIASAILTESALSFLGIGVPADVVTWGSLLNDGRQNFSAWWLVLFPGMAIFLTVTAFNIAGEALSEAMGSIKNN